MKTISSNFASEFSRRLRKLLADNDVNGVRLAEVCKVNKSTAYDWINGKGFPKNDKLEVIATFFNVSTDYLLGKDGSGEENYQVPEQIETYQEAIDFLSSLNLLRAYGGLDVNSKSEEDIINLARTIHSVLKMQGAFKKWEKY